MKLITFGQVHPELEAGVIKLLRQANCAESVELEAADPQLKTFLDSWDGQGDFIDFLSRLVEFVPDTSSTRLLLSVPGDETYRTWCKRLAEHAEWGCCISETVAVEYAPDDYRLVTQLHETLHLFGVDECYDVTSLGPRSACTLSTCLMRYGVPSTKAEVCKDVLRQLRSREG